MQPGIRDEDSYYFSLRRTDDPSNAGGYHQTAPASLRYPRHAGGTEVAVLGMADQRKGQVTMAFFAPKNAAVLTGAAAAIKLEGDLTSSLGYQWLRRLVSDCFNDVP